MLSVSRCIKLLTSVAFIVVVLLVEDVVLQRTLITILYFGVVIAWHLLHALVIKTKEQQPDSGVYTNALPG
jgi:hypothetical protein